MFVLALLIACSSTDTDTGPARDTGPTDADGDGALTPDDCDDADAYVFPGAADPPGDGVDADCDGTDGAPFVGCSPIHVPDQYPTVADALADGKTDLCLGEGRFDLSPPVEGLAGPIAIRGQGRLATRVSDPAAYGRVGVLGGLTASGAVAAGGSLSYADVTLEDAPLTDFDSLTAERTAFVRSPIDLSVQERIAGVALLDSWIDGADAGIRVTTRGCADADTCSGWFVDVRMNNCTFTDNGTALSFDVEGNYDVYLVVDNTIFLDNPVVVGVDSRSNGASASIYPGGGGILTYGTDGDGFPDGTSLRARSEDPLLDRAFAPPRPTADSPALDSAADDATITDFWGLPRAPADKGAVEGG